MSKNMELDYKVRKYEKKLGTNVSLAKKAVYEEKIRQYRRLMKPVVGGEIERVRDLIRYYGGKLKDIQMGQSMVGGNFEEEDKKLDDEIDMLGKKLEEFERSVKMGWDKIETVPTLISGMSGTIKSMKDKDDEKRNEIMKLKNDIRSMSVEIATFEYSLADDEKDEDDKFKKRSDAINNLLNDVFSDTQCVVTIENDKCGNDWYHIFDNALNYLKDTNKNTVDPDNFEGNKIYNNFIKILSHLFKYDTKWELNSIYYNVDEQCKGSRIYNFTIKNIKCYIEYTSDPNINGVMTYQRCIMNKHETTVGKADNYITSYLHVLHDQGVSTYDPNTKPSNK